MALGSEWLNAVMMGVGNPDKTIKKIQNDPKDASYNAERFFEVNANSGRENINNQHGVDVIRAMIGAAYNSGDSYVGGEIFKTALDLNETYLRGITGQDGTNQLIDRMGDYAGSFPKDSLDRESVRVQFNEFVAHKTDEEQKGFREVFENAMEAGQSIGDAPGSRNRGAQSGADDDVDADDTWNDRNRRWPSVAQPADEEEKEGDQSDWRKNLAGMLVNPTEEFAYGKVLALQCGENVGGIRFTKNGPTHLYGAAATDIDALEIAVLRHAKRSGGISVRDSAGKHTDFVMMNAAIAEWHHEHDNVIPGEVRHRYKPNKQNEAKWQMIRQKVYAHLNKKYAHMVNDYGQDAAADGGAGSQPPPPPPPAPPTNNGPDGNSGPPSGDGPKDGGNPPSGLGGGGGSPPLPQNGGGGLPPAGGDEGRVFSPEEKAAARQADPQTVLVDAETVYAKAAHPRGRDYGALQAFTAGVVAKAVQAAQTPAGKEALDILGKVAKVQLSKVVNPAVATFAKPQQTEKAIDVPATAVEDNAGTTKAANNIVRHKTRTPTPFGR